MSEKLSFNIRSCVEHEAMSAVALDAQSIVFAAADPVQPGETVKAQMNRAARNLGFKAGDWRVKAAWYLEAGCWSAALFRDFEERFEQWNARHERRARQHAANAIAPLLALRASYAESDPDFYREQIVALDAALAGMGAGTRPLDEAGGE